MAVYTLTAGPLSVDLTDGTKYVIIDGSWNVSTPGRVGFDLLVKGVDTATRVANALAVQNVINRASFAADMGQLATFAVARTGVSTASYVYTGGSFVPKTLYAAGNTEVYNVTLNTLPYLVGDSTTVTVSGTLSGTTAAIYVPSVGGDIDALVHIEVTDTSPSGVINRMHLARISDTSLNATTDFTAWVNAAALGSASTTTDATAVGGSYATRAVSGLAPLDIARAVMPAGALHRGRRDLWARVAGSGTALATPGSFVASKTDATQSTSGGVTTTPFVPSPGITIGNSDSSTIAATTATVTTNMSYTGCVSGGTLLAIVRAAGTNAGTGTASIAGFTMIGVSNDLSDRRYYVFAKVNNTTTSGTLSVVHTQTSGVSLTLDAAYVELRGVPVSSTIHVATPAANYNTTAPAITTVREGEAVVQLAAGDQSLSFPFGGYTGVVTGRAAIAVEVFPDKGADASTLALPSTFGAQGVQFAVGILPSGAISTVTTGGTTAFDEPTPGELAVGLYTARVQAIDAVGYRSNASASASATTIIARSSVTWTWAASSNASAYVLTIQAFGRFYEVITTTTSFTLTTLAGLGQVAGLPATTGALAPSPFVLARVRTLNDYTYSDLDEVATDGSGAFRLVRLGADRPLPPVGWDINGDWLDWAVEFQGRSANGASATVSVDATWTPPSREAQAVVWAHGLALATKRRWVIETGMAGRDTVAWLEDTTTGAEAGRLLTSGAPLLAPGNNVLLLAFEQAAGASVLAASVTVTLRYYPRYRLERGAV